MDEGKSPQDILDEILNRSPDKIPSPVSYPLKFDPPPEPGPLPPPDKAKEQTGPDRATQFLPWLCVILGAALLVMGICVLQVAGMNARLDELQETVKTVQAIDQLRAENEALQNELQAALDAQKAAEQDSEAQREFVDYLSRNLNNATIQKWRSGYLFYLGQFMDNGDYPMAAMVVSLSANRYFSTISELADIPRDPTQEERYQAYCRELIGKGYLQEPSSGMLLTGGSNFDLPDPYDPAKSPEMAALGILWCALNECYVLNESYTAAQFLVRYQDHTEGNYLQYLDSAATGYTLRLYEDLVSDLIEDGYLVEENGVFDYGPQPEFRLDIEYHLPFELPQLS